MSKRNGGFDPGVHDPASVDNVPIEVPLEFREPPSLQDEIRRFIRIEMSREAERVGFETFEEANDLEFSDDDDFSSASELTEDQEMVMMSVARSSRDNGGNHGGQDGVVNADGVSDGKRGADGSGDRSGAAYESGGRSKSEGDSAGGSEKSGAVGK